MAWSDVTPRAKGCIACSVCLFVVLAVMIPVSLLVIAPRVAQHVLDLSTIALPNLTQAACSQNYTRLFNHANIHVPSIGPIKLGTTIKSFKQEVWTTACAGGTKEGAVCGDNATESLMGTYTSPEMTVSPGDNLQNFDVTMNSNSTLILSAWIVPLWVAKEKTRLILTAKDVSVKVMGFTVGGLTMRNELTCVGTPVDMSKVITLPDKVCHPDDPKHPEDQSPVYTAVCTSGKQDIDPTTTSAVTTTTPVTTSTKRESDAVIV